MTKLGTELRRLREASGMSQLELAASSGVARAHLGRIEAGQQPSLATLVRIASALGEPVYVQMRRLGTYEVAAAADLPTLDAMVRVAALFGADISVYVGSRRIRLA